MLSGCDSHRDPVRSALVRDPKAETYGTVAVFLDLDANTGAQLEPNAGETRDADGTRKRVARFAAPRSFASVISLIILGIAAAGAFLVAISMLWDINARKRALPRLIVTTGKVRELDTSVWYNKTGGKQGFTRVHVDFTVNGRAHLCQRLWFFAGNRHASDPGKLYSFPPGTEVGVYYDPENPRCNALVLDQPRHGVAVIAAVVGLFFVALALIVSR